MSKGPGAPSWKPPGCCGTGWRLSCNGTRVCPFRTTRSWSTCPRLPNKPCAWRDLAKGTGSSRSRLSHAMARLEAAGWAERRSCPTDGRGEVAVLTTQGLAALEKAAPGHVTAVRECLFDALSQGQVHELGRVCQQVIHGLRAGMDRPGEDRTVPSRSA